jgi:hypothetical protein
VLDESYVSFVLGAMDFGCTVLQAIPHQFFVASRFPGALALGPAVAGHARELG